MVRFIVPLQGPEASTDWAKVSRLCNITLSTLTNQTSSTYEVVLICNELPVGFVAHPKIKIIQVNYPVPEPNTESRMKDKWKKVRVGLALFKESEDGYYMVVDADDRLSNRLVEFVLQQNYKPGWYFEEGFVFDWGYQWLYRMTSFHLVCGTSSIVFCPARFLPKDGDDPADACYIVKYGHTRIKSFFDTQEKSLRPLPFYGATYMLNTGENDSKTFYLGVKSRREQLRRLFSIRFITRQIKKEFHLWDI